MSDSSRLSARSSEPRDATSGSGAPEREVGGGQAHAGTAPSDPVALAERPPAPPAQGEDLTAGDSGPADLGVPARSAKAGAPEGEAGQVRPGSPGRARLVRHLSTAMFVLGALLLVETGLTIVWKEPITSLFAARDQRHLGSELAALQSRTLGSLPNQVRAIRNRRHRLHAVLRYFARVENARTSPGHALARLRIARLHLNFVVAQGTDDASLRRGPAHYSETVMPGERGTVGIAGHRTTYLAPFRHLDDLKRGDGIVLEAPYGRFTYSVQRRMIVPADYRRAFAPARYSRLVLTACHPLYSAAQRILVYARLISVRPSAATLRRARHRQARSHSPPRHRHPRSHRSAGHRRARSHSRRRRRRVPTAPAVPLTRADPTVAGPGPWEGLKPLLVGCAIALAVLALVLLSGVLGLRRHAGRGGQAAPEPAEPRGSAAVGPGSEDDLGG